MLINVCRPYWYINEVKIELKHQHAVSSLRLAGKVGDEECAVVYPPNGEPAFLTSTLFWLYPLMLKLKWMNLVQCLFRVSVIVWPVLIQFEVFLRASSILVNTHCFSLEGASRKLMFDVFLKNHSYKILQSSHKHLLPNCKINVFDCTDLKCSFKQV